MPEQTFEIDISERSNDTLNPEHGIRVYRKSGKLILIDENGNVVPWSELKADGLFEVANATARVTTSGQGVSIENAEDLSGKTGNYDGEIRMDDGTNTPARMTPCVWDDTNSKWRPTNAPSGSSFT
jgi:hypothetical protein